jgi:hypothetical protein
MTRTDVIREIVRRTDLEAFSERVLDSFWEVPGLQRLRPPRDELRAWVRWNVELVIRWLVEGRGPSEEELEAFRAEARSRAAAGTPAELVPANFRRGARFAWGALLEAAHDDERTALVESADLLFEYVERVSQIFSEVYATASPDPEEQAARMLLDRIARGETPRPDDYAFCEQLGFELDRAASPFVVALPGAGGLDHAALASRLRSSGAVACSEGRRVAGLSQRRTLEFDSQAVVAFGARVIRDERARALDELRLVTEAALALGRSGPQSADELLPELLLLSSPQFARRLRTRVYEPLTPELERTLETLIEHDFERGATAAALPVHRNTLRGRLRRIGELTGVEFDTASGHALAWLAYRARRVGA